MGSTEAPSAPSAIAAASHASSTWESMAVLASSGRQAMRMPFREPSGRAAATKPLAGAP